MKKAFILIIFSFIACTQKPASPPAACPFLELDANKTPQIIGPYRFIAHAGGQINGFKYTNSLDAIESSVKKGFKLIEIDLIDPNSKGDNLYGAHDWGLWKRSTKNTTLKKSDFSEEVFKKSLIYKQFSPIDLKELSSFFKKNNELYLVTDKTKDYSTLASNFYTMNKLLVEVFSQEGYFSAREKGIKYPMMAIKEDESIFNFIKKNNISMATISYKNYMHFKTKIKKLSPTTCLYMYGLMSSEEIKSIQKKYNNIGFYID